MKTTTTVCDKCGETDTESDYGWATIKFRSVEYLYDDGTQDQIYEWHMCRSCKIKVIRFMKRKGK